MSLFSNVRLFYIIGIGAMILGLVPALLVSQRHSGSAPIADVAVPTPVFGSPTAEGGPGVSPTTSAGTALPTAPALKQYSAPPPPVIDASKRYFAVLKTDKGDIRLELFAQEAPQTVNNFVFLAREGFYNGVPFHRVIPGFVGQTGDPTGTGFGGPGYTLPVEKGGRPHEAGVAAMASTTSGVLSGSQFYITYAPQPHLDGRDTVFGRVVGGAEVLQQLTPRCTSPTEAPICQQIPAGASPSRIVTVVIEEAGG